MLEYRVNVTGIDRPGVGRERVGATVRDKDTTPFLERIYKKCLT